MDELEDYLLGSAFLGFILQKAPDSASLREMAALDADLFVWHGVSQEDAQKLLTALANDAEELAREAAADHLCLFSGPNPLAPPWESVWLEREGLLFGERTSQVASIYHDWGMETAKSGQEPEDHLGLELSF